MSEIIGKNHASIVPTSSVVPACELLGGACLEAKADDVESYVAQVLKLAKSREQYQSAVDACAVSIRRRPRAGHFRLRRLDRRSGWRSANSRAAARRAFGQDARRCARERRRARLADRRHSSWR